MGKYKNIYMPVFAHTFQHFRASGQQSSTPIVSAAVKQATPMKIPKEQNITSTVQARIKYQ